MDQQERMEQADEYLSADAIAAGDRDYIGDAHRTLLSDVALARGANAAFKNLLGFADHAALAAELARIAAVGEEDLAFAEASQHVGGASTVMRLAFSQFQEDRQTVGVDERMDFRRQPASRTPHASACSDVPSGGLRVVRAPFLPLAPC